MLSAGNSARLLKKRKFKTCHLLLQDIPSGMSSSDFLFSFVKGFLLAQYKYSKKSTDKEQKPIENLIVLSSRDKRILSKAASRALLVAEYTFVTRDMVNAPSNELTPHDMAREARRICKDHDIDCRVLGPGEIKRQKMGGIIGVSQGSAHGPRLIVMHFNREKTRLPLVCLVGKGVTFDSGGISLKPWEHMEEMKGDMAGGAVVINAVAAASRFRIPLQVVGIVPCVENMPSHTALKPGDILTTHSGKTIEVLSTDAEGRLILADALSYAGSLNPGLIVDLATLTGACVIALGNRIAGVMGNNQKLIDLIVSLSKRTGEPTWQLPLDEDFLEKVKGDIADFKNYSGRDGSTSTAAALLEHFTGNVPWAHVDIAGPFWSESDSISYLPKGATGFGVNLVIDLLDALARDKKARKLLRNS